MQCTTSTILNITKKKKSTEYMNSNIANLELLKEKKGH